MVKRAGQIALESAGFLAALALDRARRPEGQQKAEAAAQRAAQLRGLLGRLGPTFVKCGQAISIRVDLLPEAYLKELRQLQDNVPPFDTGAARAILDEELRAQGGVAGVFEYLSAEPIASASLGQVYKGRLKGTGQEVAVKVQRPDVLPEISLDLYILRFFAPIIKERQNLNSDVLGLVDEWGRGFVAELVSACGRAPSDNRGPSETDTPLCRTTAWRRRTPSSSWTPWRPAVSPPSPRPGPCRT